MLKEGYPFLLAGLLLAAPFLVWGGPWGLLALSIPFYVVWFFRNPRRVPPSDEKSLLSPADGKIIFVGEVEEQRYLEKKMQKVSIFMSPVDVHVNRIPITGQIKGIYYNKGKYFSAFKEKASLDNEQNAVSMESTGGYPILFVQIAGFLARRIVCYLKVGDNVRRGERYGLIRFGSRMDVYMPTDFKLTVNLGERVRGGETILGRLL